MLNRNARPLRMDRRGFLKTSSALASFVGLWVSGALPLRAMTQQRTLAELDFTDFQALLGEHFQVYSHVGLPSTVQLVQVKARPSQTKQADNLRSDCFSLAFAAPKGHGLTQDSYTFVHPELGQFALFIVPAQQVEYEDRYIAIFNRL